MVDLHAALGTATNPFRRAYDINNAGILAGVLNQPSTYDPWPKAVVVDTNSMTLQSLDKGTHPHTTAHAISNVGQIVGYCEQNPRYYAASWADSSASLAVLYPTPADEGPTSSQSSWAYDVNDHGVVVGRSRGMSLGGNLRRQYGDAVGHHDGWCPDRPRSDQCLQTVVRTGYQQLGASRWLGGPARLQRRFARLSGVSLGNGRRSR